MLRIKPAGLQQFATFKFDCKQQYKNILLLKEATPPFSHFDKIELTTLFIQHLDELKFNMKSLGNMLIK